MKIEKIRIQKFRSIDDVSIRMGQVLAVVGQNNAGKSHILRALNSFFNFGNEQKDFLNQSHAFSLKSRPRIEIVFSDIGEDDHIPSQYLASNKLILRFTYRWDRKTPTYEVIKGREAQTIGSEVFQTLISAFCFIYVPIVRNSDSAFSSEHGIAYTLLKSIVAQQVAKRNTLQPLIEKLYKKVENTSLETAQKRIKKYYPFEKNTDFQLHITDADIIDTIIRHVTLELIENSQNNDIRNCGSGIQSAIYFAISLAASMESNCSYMVGIEEPELNMHPQAQQTLIESLKNIAKYPNTQFVMTTHSTVIIDRLGHEAIVLCRKVKGETRDIITTASQTCEDFWEKYRMQEERYSNFFEYKNSDFFFSNYVIITESSIDCGIITHVLEKSGIHPTDTGITFIPADGEKNIKYPYAIVKELNIPFFCVVDRDVFQPYNGENRKDSINEHGMPTYRAEIKASSPICELISDSDKQILLNHLHAGQYEQTLNVLDKYSIIVMRYAIEIDLLVCASYFEFFCDVLNILPENRTPRFLAIERSTVIKRLDNICAVLDRASMRNLPASYRAIIKKTRAMLSRRTTMDSY